MSRKNKFKNPEAVYFVKDIFTRRKSKDIVVDSINYCFSGNGLIMRHSLLILIILIIFSCQSKTNNHPVKRSNIKSENEHVEIEDYLATRDRYIRFFEKKDNSDLDHTYHQIEDSLKILEKKLQVILSGSRIHNLNTQGKINLQTLMNELGFGMLDGLITQKKSDNVFCTSQRLFSEYYRKDHLRSYEHLTPTELEKIFNDTFGSEAHITNITSFRIETSPDAVAYCMVATVGQDVGPIPPNAIYVFISSKDYIYMMEQPLHTKVREFDKCQMVWDSICSKSQQELENYRSSDLKGSKTLKRTREYEDKEWDMYCNYYRNNLKNASEFASIKRQAESFVKRILKRQ